MRKCEQHPWPRWFEALEKKSLVLLRGKDFSCQPHSLAMQIRQRAAQRKLKCSIRINEGELIVSCWEAT